ncbi:hypothetical protein C0J52_06524 [Blattella germanica]|nr:hypothetical protein C0J52_06524 [Blattella germanica]
MSNEMYPIGCDPVHFEQSLTVLLTRLEKLFLYLREKAHNVEKNYLLLINHLLNPGFLFHEEPLVKIMVACCLAQLFHLFPESIIQFDDEDLMNIFTFYIQLLQYLGTVDKVGLPFFKALMKTLNKTDVFVELFKSLKSVENKNSIYDNVMLVICKGVCERENVLRLEQHILIFLHTFINGTKHNSEKGIAVILKCLLNENAIKHPIMNQLAGKVMQKCESTLYFPVRMLLYKGLDQEMECEIPEAIDGHEFELMYELHYVCPNILVGLWNQLELLISEPDSHSKKKPALILLAHMFSDKNSDFAKKYRCLWFKFKKWYVPITLFYWIQNISYWPKYYVYEIADDHFFSFGLLISLIFLSRQTCVENNSVNCQIKNAIRLMGCVNPLPACHLNPPHTLYAGQSAFKCPGLLLLHTDRNKVCKDNLVK